MSTGILEFIVKTVLLSFPESLNETQVFIQQIIAEMHLIQRKRLFPAFIPPGKTMDGSRTAREGPECTGQTYSGG